MSDTSLGVDLDVSESDAPHNVARVSGKSETNGTCMAVTAEKKGAYGVSRHVKQGCNKPATEVKQG